MDGRNLSTSQNATRRKSTLCKKSLRKILTAPFAWSLHVLQKQTRIMNLLSGNVNIFLENLTLRTRYLESRHAQVAGELWAIAECNCGQENGEAWLFHLIREISLIVERQMNSVRTIIKGKTMQPNNFFVFYLYGVSNPRNDYSQLIRNPRITYSLIIYIPKCVEQSPPSAPSATACSLSAWSTAKISTASWSSEPYTSHGVTIAISDFWPPKHAKPFDLNHLFRGPLSLSVILSMLRPKRKILTARSAFRVCFLSRRTGSRHRKNMIQSRFVADMCLGRVALRCGGERRELARCAERLWTKRRRRTGGLKVFSIAWLIQWIYEIL